jgi:hypothetical protein
VTDDTAGVLLARWQDRTYSIPQIWLAGYMEGVKARGENVTIREAIAWWAYQQELAELEAEQNTEVGFVENDFDFYPEMG